MGEEKIAMNRDGDHVIMSATYNQLVQFLEYVTTELEKNIFSNPEEFNSWAKHQVALLELLKRHGDAKESNGDIIFSVKTDLYDIIQASIIALEKVEGEEKRKDFCEPPLIKENDYVD